MINMRIVNDVIMFTVPVLFACVIVSLLIRDIRNAKLKSIIRKNGVLAQAEILNVEAYTGKISDYTNIKLHYKFTTDEGVDILGTGSAVIYTSDLRQYQIGKFFDVTYNKYNPSQVIMEIENASLKRRRR